MWIQAVGGPPRSAAKIKRELPPMAATNKCLAQINKSPGGGSATKKRLIGPSRSNGPYRLNQRRITTCQRCQEFGSL
jgi:hypothetical protein